MSEAVEAKPENSTDASRGQPLAQRVLARKDELEAALANCSEHDLPLKTALDTALATVHQMMTGDLAHPSEVVARSMNDWLERNKHLAIEPE